MAFSDARNERDRAETGKNSSNHGGGDRSKAEKNNREAMGQKVGGGKMGSKSSQSAAKSSKAGNYSDARDDPVAKEHMARNQDAQNIGESWGDGFGGFMNEIGHGIAGLLGFDEEEQDFSTVANDMARPEYNGPDAGTPDNMRGHWSIDPIDALTNFAGMATGVPINSAYKLGKYAYEQVSGKKLGTEIDLGRDVFAREDSPSSPTTKGAASSGAASDNVRSGETKTASLQKDGGKGNGLLGSMPSRPPSGSPTTPPNPTNPPASPPPAGQAGGYPTPSQRFSAPSYYAGNWVRDPNSNEIVFKPHASGLLA